MAKDAARPWGLLTDDVESGDAALLIREQREHDRKADHADGQGDRGGTPRLELEDL